MSNRRIRKLTPAILKKIILEEKRNVRKAFKNKRKKSARRKSFVGSEIQYLNETKKRQKKLVREFKKLYVIRQKLKKSLIKRL